MKDLERQMKALANKRRLAILKYLKRKREANVGDIATEIKLSLKATSKHLSLLYTVGMLNKEQRNVLVYYSLAKSPQPAAKQIIAML